MTGPSDEPALAIHAVVRNRVSEKALDAVAELPSSLQEGGQIRWETVNHDQESVAPGVYLYKVTMPEREAYWGRLVIIR